MKNLKLSALAIVIGMMLATLLVACGDSNATSTPTAVSSGSQLTNGYKTNVEANLFGGGSSFANKPYQRWIDIFTNFNPKVNITYNSIGSGAGVKAFLEHKVDFAGTDTIPAQTDLDKYGKPIMFVPTLTGGITVPFNLPGIRDLKLSPASLGGIFGGKITRWNDASLKAENGGVNLPDQEITLVVRSDSSGTSNVFTSYLNEVSPAFKALGLSGNRPDWTKNGKIINSAPQNEGVAYQVSQISGAIGYVDYANAITDKLTVAQIKNAAGNYIAPGISAFYQAEPTGDVKPNSSIKLLNSSNPQAYPITTVSFIMLEKDWTDSAKAETLVTYLWWATHEAQPIGFSYEIGFASVPKAVLPIVEEQLKQITVNGTPVLKGSSIGGR